MSTITTYAPVTEKTARVEYGYRKVDFNQAVADFCEMMNCNFVRFRRSDIMTDEDGPDSNSAKVYRVTCPECGKRFVDVAHVDPTESFTICPHCNEQITY